ncbi:hypothetical protein ABDK56_09310 [Sphingomonas sp. ASV193]|uniref:hypothetical protein n=1 Tax=Sphingomonas sp. ASV193 TaxID=3144405 RepID=UPI0032E877B7
MKRSGGVAGRPFYHYSIDEMEAHVKKVGDLSDLKALRAELGFRKSKRARELDDLLARLHHSWTDSFDPGAGEKGTDR